MNDFLPNDINKARLIGRINTEYGPTPIYIDDCNVYDISKAAPTVSDFIEFHINDFTPKNETLIGNIQDFDFLSSKSQIIAPIDLQCIKACGVTFAVSIVERVIEERARGDFAAANEIRAKISSRIGIDLQGVVPGSEEADKLKEILISEGLWSQYLEVAIGKDAEVFTKSPVLSAIGYGGQIGIRSDSSWNNPEPEIALVVNSNGEAIGATMANDVNLRCFEGRSALLLGKAKDNNASCALGPFIRLFDEKFSIDEVRSARLDLTIEGQDGFKLQGHSNMSLISRDPLELVRQTMSQHQYPDGFALLLGTLFSPTQDRDEVGKGFTHKFGDIVKISNDYLGVLQNEVVYCDSAPSWKMGISGLYKNLSKRGLLTC